MGDERRGVLVVGATGVVGRTLATNLATSWQVTGTHHCNPGTGTLAFDLASSDPKALPLDWSSQRAVVIAAGVTALGACARDSVGSRRINVDGTLRLAEVALAAGATPVFLSSDAVFRGELRGAPQPKNEQEPPDPGTEYGRQKLAVESELPRDRALVLRLTKVGDGFLQSIARHLDASQPVRAATDQFLSLLAARDIARTVDHALDADLRGLYHVAAPPVRSRFEWCSLLARAIGADPTLVAACSIGEFDDIELGETLARDSSLDGTALAALLPFGLESGDAQIEKRRR